MDKNLDKILGIDQEIGDFLYDNDNLSDKEISTKFEEHRFVDRAIKILNKLSNNSMMELLKRSRYLRDFIDIKKFYETLAKLSKKPLIMIASSGITDLLQASTATFFACNSLSKLSTLLVNILYKYCIIHPPFSSSNLLSCKY